MKGSGTVLEPWMKKEKEHGCTPKNLLANFIDTERL